MADATRSLRVLVVDDEQLIADSLATILRNNGFHATSAYSGYSAIEIATSCEPDVIISDILMPGVNGIDAALDVSRRLPNARFFFLSGYGGFQENLGAARARGLNFTYLEKPVPPPFLIGCLKDYEREMRTVLGPVFA